MCGNIKFGDGHGFMNSYRTLTLKKIHKLSKVSNDCVQEMCQGWACVMISGVTYVNVSFHIRVIRQGSFAVL